VVIERRKIDRLCVSGDREREGKLTDCMLVVIEREREREREKEN
jgi:hypothetical protein